MKFYQTVLNMRIVYEIQGRVRFTALSFDEENHRVGLIERPQLQTRPPDTVRIEHSSWRYRSLGEALETVRHVEKELGIFPNAVHQGPIISISYQDPDKNRCELIVDCAPTQADIITFYHETLAENPDFDTLMPFDLRGMLEKEAAGEPLEHLLSYTWVRDNLPPLTSKRYL
ncbi:hypothetical protein XhyaCFBP1156_03680 [Xanthomonas hyacinthi]|uniref:VOC domain-containing protein n=1 Tax=Xanthomonas hyacinthi TaxID=56455 RepID=A0A2S7F1X5_9XANT|nr:hypothetical protein XhyaCFBP1156_03680 [Xanthomonas hyacinthi]